MEVVTTAPAEIQQAEPPGQYVTLDELSQIARIPKSWLYERSRRNALPGLRRLGRLIRVDLGEFKAGLKHAGIE